MKRKLCLLFFVYFGLSLGAMNNATAGKKGETSILFPRQTLNKTGENNLHSNSFNDLNPPSPLVIDSRFLDGYKAELKIKSTGKRIVFDLQKNKKLYEKNGLFFKSRLNEPTELTVHSFSSLDPVIMYGGVAGIRGVQQITGVDKADTIATVESYWIFTDGHWLLQRVVVNGKNAS